MMWELKIMIELEENKHKLIELQKKIKNIGDSL
jgi:hypothetical protein